MWVKNVAPPVCTAVSLVLSLSLLLYHESCMHEGNILSSLCCRCRDPHASRISFRVAKNRHCIVRPIHMSYFIILGGSHQPEVALLWELQTVPWATESRRVPASTHFALNGFSPSAFKSHRLLLLGVSVFLPRCPTPHVASNQKILCTFFSKGEP